MKEADKAKELFAQGYSCSEAAWLAMAQDMSQEERNLGLKLAGGFGGGVASGGLCGALAGAVLGLGRYLGREEGGERPEQLRAVTKALCASFKAKYGSLDCSEIKPQTDNYRETCAEYVYFAVEEALRLLDEALEDDDCG